MTHVRSDQELSALCALAKAGDVAALEALPALVARLRRAERRILDLEKALAEVAVKRGGVTGTAREALGLAHGNAKLTPAQFAAIRRDPRSLRVIAAAYGVHYTTISRIKSVKRSPDPDSSCA